MSDTDRIAFERALSNETLGGFMNDTITLDNPWSMWRAARDLSSGPRFESRPTLLC
jgi:hypothetical protein